MELFQVWIHPRTKGLSPRYEQRDFRDLDTSNRWAMIISGDGREGSMRIQQDATIATARLDRGKTLVCAPIQQGYGRLLLVIEGEVTIAEYALKRRDEVQVIGEEGFEITANSDAQVLMFEVPIVIM